MTLVPEIELASRRLARFIDNPDVPEVARAIADLADPKVRSFVARGMRSVALNEVLDALSEPGLKLSSADMLVVTNRVFAAARMRMRGVFPDDIVEEAFATCGGAA